MYLTKEQVKCFERDGYLAPLEFCTTEKMDLLRPSINDALGRKLGPHGRDRWGSRHQDCRVVYEICASPAIVDTVATLLGPDVILWNSVFFNKEPGGREIPWHQDRDFLLLEPVVNVAVWLAIDDANVENGCLQVIPGSHRNYVPHIPRTHSHEFDARADTAYIERSKAVNIELSAGQFIIFHKKILHHSLTNLSIKRRLGLAMRYTVPGVKVNVEEFFEGYFVYLVQGNDLIGSNPTGVIPQD